MDKETVRLAVKRAEESGFIQGWRVVINPNLLGQRSAAFQLDVGSGVSKADAISQIRLVDGVILIFDFHGRGLRIVFNYETDRGRERKLGLFRSICRSRDENSLHWVTTLPACEMRLRNVDWQILKAICKNPRRNVGEVALEVGVSTRTVNRRIEAMVAGKTLYLIPVRNVARSMGLLCNFAVKLEERAQKDIESVMEPLRRRIDFVHRERGLYNVSVVLDNIRRADEITERLNRVDGVAEVRMNIIKDFIFVDDWVDEVIQLGRRGASRQMKSWLLTLARDPTLFHSKVSKVSW